MQEHPFGFGQSDPLAGDVIGRPLPDVQLGSRVVPGNEIRFDGITAVVLRNLMKQIANQG